jgi:hypothetical protein
MHMSSLAKENDMQGRKFGLDAYRRFLYRVAAEEWRGVRLCRRCVEEGRGASTTHTRARGGRRHRPGYGGAGCVLAR